MQAPRALPTALPAFNNLLLFACAGNACPAHAAVNSFNPTPALKSRDFRKAAKKGARVPKAAFMVILNILKIGCNVNEIEFN